MTNKLIYCSQYNLGFNLKLRNPITHEVVKMVTWETALLNGHEWGVPFDLCGEHEHKLETYYDREQTHRYYMTGEVVAEK